MRSPAAWQALRGVAHTTHAALPSAVVFIALSDRAALAEGLVILLMLIASKWMDSIGHGEGCDELAGLPQFSRGRLMSHDIFTPTAGHFGNDVETLTNLDVRRDGLS